ncbi:TIGR00180 family glycosyltransferase [Pelagibacteraceae bacterium]|nr:TIGR00180 family glycosyltransferase [Pelagibacteraceae bacterium]
MLNNFTLIILTYNRYNILLRALEFYLSFKLQFKILILDSSTMSQTDNIKSILTDNKNLQIIKFPNTIKVFNKIEQGIAYVHSEYCAVSADDDFLLPSTFKKYLKFLKNNTDYSSVHGLYFSHKKINVQNKNYINYNSLYNKKAKSNDGPDQFERIKKYLNSDVSYYPVYAISKLEYLKIIIRNTNKYSINTHFDEFLVMPVHNNKELFSIFLMLLADKLIFFTTVLCL